jgi:hypothetical protein
MEYLSKKGFIVKAQFSNNLGAIFFISLCCKYHSQHQGCKQPAKSVCLSLSGVHFKIQGHTLYLIVTEKMTTQQERVNLKGLKREKRGRETQERERQ